MPSTKKSNEESPTTKKKKPTKEHPQENGHINGKDNRKKKNKVDEEELEDDVISVPDSSASDSDKEGTIEISGDDEEEIEEIEEVEEEVKKGKGKRKGKAKDTEDEEERVRFPMARIKRIMKVENPSLQAGADVVFLLNKATEKFLEQFCEEAYDAMVRDSKKSLAYKNLASVVKEEERYDFLRDYVPEKLTAKDALKERNSAEMS